jgi:hypothetical protein
MKKLEIYLCDNCEGMIMPVKDDEPPGGFMIEGNIYVAQKGEGGLIGDNFPMTTDFAPADSFQRSQIRKTCLCTDCFLRALELKPKKHLDADDAMPYLM